MASPDWCFFVVCAGFVSLSRFSVAGQETQSKPLCLLSFFALFSGIAKESCGVCRYSGLFLLGVVECGLVDGFSLLLLCLVLYVTILLGCTCTVKHDIFGVTLISVISVVKTQHLNLDYT